MTTSTFTTQLTSGQTLRTLTTCFKQGSGFSWECWDSWKGQEASLSTFSDRTWSSSEEEAFQEMSKAAEQMKAQGWK